MSAQPADDYTQSRSARIPFRPPAEVISLPVERDKRRTTPEQNQDDNAQTVTSNSGRYSGTGITVSDVPGDWVSVVTVWTGAPESLRDMATRVTSARDKAGDRAVATVGLACWAVLVFVPRGLLHLASWVLTHPFRVLAFAMVAVVFVATL